MLSRFSFSNTKKFFRKTLDNFKSFLSGGYQRFPKSPPFNPFSCGGGVDMTCTHSFRELDKFYTDFNHHWDSHTAGENDKTKKSRNSNQGEEGIHSSHQNSYDEERGDQMRRKKKMKRIGYGVMRREEKKAWDEVVRERRSCLVERKLKELEMMDKSNVEHVLDIEEVLHYYSRLTCPAYLDIVDEFFMEMYVELLSSR